MRGNMYELGGGGGGSRGKKQNARFYRGAASNSSDEDMLDGYQMNVVDAESDEDEYSNQRHGRRG